jgi:hypothetical protein
MIPKLLPPRRSAITRKLVTALTAVTMASAAALVTGFVLSANPVSAAPADSYSWKNVAIGGGGFVDGIVFNQGQANLIYARTDIGGAYRWNQSSSSWTPLLDWVGTNNWGYNGVVSLATDAVDPTRVYAAVGMYTNDWDPNNGAILRSTNQGATWSATPLPFKLGGNMPGRGQGERLSIDPNRNSTLYFGAPSGHGLWRSTDSGVTWAQVTSFPNPGNYVQQAGDAYLGDNQGVLWVDFDKTTGTAGNATQTIYVGVADKNNPVYRSTNGGSTWSAVPGAPTGYLPHQGVLDTVNHQLYIATSDTGGPYDGAKGDVWKYGTATGTWTQISPIPSSSTDDYFGYSGLTIDRQHPNTIMVATQISWWPDAIFFRSTDGGATWTRIWDFASYPSRTTRYTLNVTSEPWLTFGAAPADPVPSPKLGWMNESVSIDPFNSNRMMYGTGATLYGTNNLTNWDTGGQITITPMVTGLEETAALDLISPPTGAPLLSALGDIGGFVHTSLTSVPAMMYTQPNLGSTTSIDFAELNPATIVRSGNVDTTASPGVTRAGFSTNSGGSWFQASSEPGGVTAGGTIAESANASATVWSPTGAQVSYSTTYGSSWTGSSGIPSGAQVRSDRVNPAKFYGFNAGTFYVSTNSGASFTATAATGLPSSGNVYFKAVAGHEGDIWLAGGTGTTYGLWHSTNSGASFTKLANVDQADNVGFGKAAPGQTYPALYIVAQVGGVRGVFRSDDSGTNWVRINDDQHQYGNIGGAITGDPRIYGRVYLGTNGRGVLYADRLGVSTPTPTGSATPSRTPSVSPTPSRTPSVSPTPSRTPSVSPTPSRTPSVSPTPSRTPSVSPTPSRTPSSGPTGTPGGCRVTYALTGSWAGGFQADVKITNTGTAAINGWTLKWSFANGQVISSAWNSTVTQAGTAVTATNVSYNGTIATGQQAEFGFLSSWNNTTNATPTAFTVNGANCTIG